ncbi:trace amine-associated receptor 13c-like [Hoplias malabaricus]|uniref:trace amine-associated receptor 13c-like n=1 Tax=Hoplias malabaricus TaxID=27720 RepID=UPI0034623A5B
MDGHNYRQNNTIQYCFPDNNASCEKETKESLEYILLCFILSCVSVCTVFLNLLVIISISHFKQLHTPTNLLILSLAVADFLLGLIMPVDIMQLMDSCWYLGIIACYMSPIISFVAMYGSLWCLTLIAVDRYIAITDPLHYSRRITVQKTLLSVILGWCFYLCYTILYLYFNDYFFQPQLSTQCYGECFLAIKYYWVIIDLVVAFIAPCSVIIILYSSIFKVARHQAKSIRVVNNRISNKNGTKMLGSSEIKAAKKLGTVVFVYLACWIPYYLSSVSVDNLTSSSVVWNILGWLLDFNSSVNPLIYSIFYSWFKASLKYIVTCRIFESSSSRFNLLIEH